MCTPFHAQISLPEVIFLVEPSNRSHELFQMKNDSRKSTNESG